VVVARYLYDPFGNTLAMSGPKALINTYRFSSKPIHDGLGWYDYLRRWYAPEMQRWPNRDPIGERGGINLCGFVANDPVDRNDPLGLCTVYLCHRPVDFLPGWAGRGLAGAGLDHQFLKASFTSSEVGCCLLGSSGSGGEFSLSSQLTLEVGLGEEGGGVPGQNSPLNPLNWYPGTQPVDHSGQSSRPGTTCEPISIQDCCGLLKSMLNQSPTGRRFPAYNCHSWVCDERRLYGPQPPPPYSGGPINTPSVIGF
jgi:RHS repeat-associated protein